VQLGYLSRQHADWIAPMLDRGASAEASVVTVAPKGRPFSPLALNLRLRLGGDEPR
jgi:CelD/BcsL family acetyltransferase involved in cellulose biosynthesis